MNPIVSRPSVPSRWLTADASVIVTPSRPALASVRRRPGEPSADFPVLMADTAPLER